MFAGGNWSPTLAGFPEGASLLSELQLAKTGTRGRKFGVGAIHESPLQSSEKKIARTTGKWQSLSDQDNRRLLVFASSEALLESNRRLDGPQGPKGQSIFIPKSALHYVECRAALNPAWFRAHSEI